MSCSDLNISLWQWPYRTATNKLSDIKNQEEALTSNILSFQVADKVFGTTLYKAEQKCEEEWFNTPLHPLQEQEPLGDRKWIADFEVLQVTLWRHRTFS